MLHFVSIFLDTLKVNSSICLRMYFMKASLDHLPIIMMAKTGTPPRYIAIADPDRMECVPTSCFWILSFVSPKATTPSLSAVSIILLVMWVSLLDVHTADIGVAGVVPL